MMVEQNNQVARELIWLDAKKPDPSSLNVRQLRGRVSVRNYTHPPLDSHPLAQYVCMVQFKI